MKSEQMSQCGQSLSDCKLSAATKTSFFNFWTADSNLTKLPSDSLRHELNTGWWNGQRKRPQWL